MKLLSAIGDVLGSHAMGFGMRVANVAARFAVRRGGDPETVAAAYFAGALHEIGLVRVVIGSEANARDGVIAGWDAPPNGARIAAAIEPLPPATADLIRWHRESFDGMGFPDRLLWGGIPPEAMALNVARAFVAAIEAQGEYASPPEAMFTLVGESGRTFHPGIIRAFREFYSAEGAAFDAPFEPAWPLDGVDAAALIAEICAEIDARDERTRGRGTRLAELASAIAVKLHDGAVDGERVAFAARLTSLGRLGSSRAGDDFDPLARLGRESRAAEAATAARLLVTTPTFAPFAAIVGATSEWFDGTGLPRRLSREAIDPAARVLSVVLAADALSGSTFAMPANGYPDAPIRIAAAAGTQFDPAVVNAYSSIVGASA